MTLKNYTGYMPAAAWIFVQSAPGLFILATAGIVFLAGCGGPGKKQGGPSVIDTSTAAVWTADNGDGTYLNPVIHADYSDPDVVRVGEDFYMVSSSFNCVPGLPVLHSKDLVNWQIVNHIIPRLEPDSVFSRPQHGNGVWAPAIRYHKGEYYVYYGDPDFGIYMSKASDPLGKWTVPHLLRPARGWIDPCPFWDDDGKAYLVRAYAGSRSGRKSILVIHRMNKKGTRFLDDGVLVFDGHEDHPTIEGPKIYKRNGYYYIFAPGGGVTHGWQTVLRSRNIYGPYEDRVVLHRGSTDINGPHQGAWIELENGESWFMHFQDKKAYGRIVHLQPMEWINDWPVIGEDVDGDGTGEPVASWKMPSTGHICRTPGIASSDEFNSPAAGLQWQWHANPQPEWMFLSGSQGYMRLYCKLTEGEDPNLWEVPNLYLQKFPAEEFTATAKLDFQPRMDGDRCGLLVMGMDYASLVLEQINRDVHYYVQTRMDAASGGEAMRTEHVKLNPGDIYLRVGISKSALCTFSISTDGQNFTEAGEGFRAVPGRWIGAKLGLYALGNERTNDTGWADFDWFRVSR